MGACTIRPTGNLQLSAQSGYDTVAAGSRAVGIVESRPDFEINMRLLQLCETAPVPRSKCINEYLRPEYKHGTLLRRRLERCRRNRRWPSFTPFSLRRKRIETSPGNSSGRTFSWDGGSRGCPFAVTVVSPAFQTHFTLESAPRSRLISYWTRLWLFLRKAWCHCLSLATSHEHSGKTHTLSLTCKGMAGQRHAGRLPS